MTSVMASLNEWRGSRPMSSENIAMTACKINRYAESRSIPRSMSLLKTADTIAAVSRVTATRSLPKVGFSWCGSRKASVSQRRGRSSRLTRFDGLFELPVEVVDPELVEVAQHDELGPVRDEVYPVLERLTVILREVAPGLLHLDEDAGLPLQIGVCSAAVVAPLDTLLQRRAGLPHTLMPESAEQVLQGDGRLALLVADQMVPAVANEAVESLAKLVCRRIGRHARHHRCWQRRNRLLRPRSQEKRSADDP
jgi:hypothetical protein